MQRQCFKSALKRRNCEDVKRAKLWENNTVQCTVMDTVRVHLVQVPGTVQQYGVQCTYCIFSIGCTALYFVIRLRILRASKVLVQVLLVL